MSTDYRLEKQILMNELFGGQLRKYGVWPAHDAFKPIDDFGVLTDGKNQIGVYGDEYVEILKRCGNNNPNGILRAIEEAFDTEIYSEFSPQFWGFETEREWLAAEAYQDCQTSHSSSEIETERYPGECQSKETDAVKIGCGAENEYPLPESLDEDLIARILRRANNSDEYSACNQATDRWAEFKEREILRYTQCETVAAEIAIQLALDEYLLLDHFTLWFKNFGLVSVAELLADPTTFDGQELVDPLKSDYTDFDCRFDWDNGNPFIFGFREDGKDYFFHKNQVNKAVLLYGISAAQSAEGKEFAHRALKAAVDLLFGAQ